MSSKLAMYWQPYHINGDPFAPSGDWAILARWQPPSVRLFQYWWPDPLFMEQLFRLLPNSVINLRDHPLSEEKNEMLGDPVATGRRHAQSFIDRIAPLRAVKGFSALRLLIAGVNEPPVRTDEQIAALVAYEVARLDVLRAAGLRGLALNLSVGWPRNTGKDTPVEWVPFEPVRAAILRGQHMLGLHEYWGPQGPAHWRGWWVDRLGQCPWDVPILVGECGEDHGVVDGRNDGWMHVGLTPEVYLEQLKWYDQNILQRDRRVFAGEVFSYDAVDPFKSFDIRGSVAEGIAAYAESIRGQAPPPALPFPRYPDKVTPPEPEPPLPPGGGDSFEAWLRQRGTALATVPVTPGFALYDAILDDGLLPNGPETRESYGGRTYTLRSAEHPTDAGGPKYTYYVEVPPPGKPWPGVKRLWRGGARDAPPVAPTAPALIERPSPNHDARPDGDEGRVSAIVLHATAGSAGASLSWLTNPASGASTHYLITKDGRTYRLVEDSRRAWHAGVSRYKGREDWNDFSLGVELENNNDGRDPYPAAQLATAVRLLRWLVHVHNIKRGWAVTHAQIAQPPGRKSDPAGLDVAALLAEVFG